MPSHVRMALRKVIAERRQPREITCCLVVAKLRIHLEKLLTRRPEPARRTLPLLTYTNSKKPLIIVDAEGLIA